jgi:N-acetylneuraminate synthase
MESFSTRIKGIASTFNTDTIFILGKGPSADLVMPEVLASSLVIGINDAERIIPTDITIFHEPWVEQAIRDNGERARLYITSTEFKAKLAEVFYAPYAHLTQDNVDLMFQRLLSDELVIEEVMFMTALQICRSIAQMRKREQKVYMVGFDFSPSLGNAAAVRNDYSRSSLDLRMARIAPQENYLLNALYILKDTSLNIIHVGNKAYSRTTAEQLNQSISQSNEQDSILTRPHSVAVVAEMTTNHFGERYRLERIIRAVKAAGADYVKLQKRDVDSFYTQKQLKSDYHSPFGKTFADYRHAIELSAEDFDFVDQLCKKIGIGWFASILDEKSYHFMMQFTPQIIKLPSTISEHTRYLEMVADSYDRDLVISTGMTDNQYEKWILKTFKKSRKMYILQCSSAYPTPLEHCNVAVVRHYYALSKKDKRIIPGYSSHDMGWYASALAVAAGAGMIEKHVKLGNTEWAHFDAVALDLTSEAFGEFVRKIRETEIITGSEDKQINTCEHHKYKQVAIEETGS